MSFDDVLLIGVAIGLILVGMAFFTGRRDKESTEITPAPAEPAAPDPPDEDPTDETDPADDAMARLADTVDALKRLAQLKHQELERDAAEREELRTSWAPLSEETGGGEAPTEAPAPEPELEPATIPTPAQHESDRPLPPMVNEVSQVRLEPSTKMHPDSAAKLRLSVGQAFTPAAPVARRELFTGREKQLETLIEVVFERGQHAIVYGERGVGKTSLATILALVLSEEPVRVPLRVNCDADDDFDSVWRKILEELELAFDTLGKELPKVRAAMEKALAKPKLGPNDASRLLKQLAPDIEAIVIIDEFDMIPDQHAPRLFADTIKMLSDQLVPSTLVLLGVADTLGELLAEHGSISRAVVHVQMPRMSTGELKDIVARGLDLLTMDIEDDALDLIARLSQGFPHFTHLLAQGATRAAIDAQRPLVTVDDVQVAAAAVIGRIETWVQDAYDKATDDSSDATYAQVLLAAALADTDDRGYFAPADAKEPMARIVGTPQVGATFTRHLNALAEKNRGPVLVKVGTDRKRRYRFIEPQMEPYVIMRSLREGTITHDVLGGSDEATAPANA